MPLVGMQSSNIELKSCFILLRKHHTPDDETIESAWLELQNRYNQAHRHYHTLEHIQAMVGHFRQVEHLITNPDAVLFAIFYHDIIYEVTNNAQAKSEENNNKQHGNLMYSELSNERQSALFFGKIAEDIGYVDSNYVMQMIKDTERHELSTDADTNFLLDIDLTILGSQPKIYQQYCQQIREEYRIYDDEAYRTGRKQVLEHLLNQKTIYKTDYFINRYEQQAQINLAHELSKL